MKQVIEKLKSQQKQNSQQSNPIQKPAKRVEVAPIEEEFEDEDEEEDEEDLEEVAPKPQIKKKPAEISQETGQDEEKIDERDKILMEIEMLQNNGRYRVELLHQLQEMNKALVVIAGILVENGKNK